MSEFDGIFVLFISSNRKQYVSGKVTEYGNYAS
ncbi:hypothetical protein T4C_1881 [Trichinella pseudospiralis]|uniref:Uncharacterized protein n=1 Tax=Trichinella pseudospiralis TaxID=6337 RepID=A0A0V1GFL9_TRIPS|nr:hypothetical protein T4C_1881 [Trichinella pseudospiralis]